MDKKKAIWFSRHAPTAEQLQEIAAGPYQLVGIEEGRALGARALTSDKDVAAVMDGIAKNLVAFEAEAIFGVFPTPILAQWDLAAAQAQFMGYSVPRYPCFASWNSQRSEEGKPPTFVHKRWMQVASC
jgi:hypothetical protein